MKPLDESLRDHYILRPSKFEKRLPLHYSVHPFVQNTKYFERTYKRNVLIRWHLLLRLSLNPELIKLRKHRIMKPYTRKEEFISKVKKVIQLNKIAGKLKKRKEKETRL